MTVSGNGKNTIYVADAEVARQIVVRQEGFGKPTELYRILEVFGENVVTTEGGRWRRHRRATAGGFNERNNR